MNKEYNDLKICMKASCCNACKNYKCDIKIQEQEDYDRWTNVRLKERSEKISRFTIDVEREKDKWFRATEEVRITT